MRFIVSTFVLGFFSSSLLGALPPLITKQRIENIRYFSSDGKVTYFQKRSGQLLLSKNYKVLPLIESERWSNFQVHASPKEEYIVIEHAFDHHTNINFLKNNDIYLGKLGEEKVEKITNGRTPKLHLEDSWLSYYWPRRKKINFYFIPTKEEKISIKIAAGTTPFFFPQVIVLNAETILYTDINESGHAALIAYNTINKTLRPLYKSGKKGTRLQVCQANNRIVLGEFSLQDTFHGSSIFQFDLKENSGLKNYQPIYQSQLNDLGNLLCDEDHLYFIKTVSEEESLKKRITEVAKLNLNNKKVTILSNLQKVQHLVRVGDKIFTPFRDRIYVVKGKSNLKKDVFNTQKRKREE